MKSFFICVAMAAWSLVKLINRSLWFRAGRLLLKGKEKKSRKQGNSTEQETNGCSASEMWSDRGQWLTCLQRELWSNPFRPCPQTLSWGGDWRWVWCRSVAVQVELVGCELNINKHVWSRADDTCLHTCGHAQSGLTSSSLTFVDVLPPHTWPLPPRCEVTWQKVKCQVCERPGDERSRNCRGVGGEEE